MPVRSSTRWLQLAGSIILTDQISKWIVLGALRPGEAIYVAPFFNWVLTFNTGAAFSFLSDAGGWQALHIFPGQCQNSSGFRNAYPLVGSTTTRRLIFGDGKLKLIKGGAE